MAPVGALVQADDAWRERTCPTCSSPHCTADHDLATDLDHQTQGAP